MRPEYQRVSTDAGSRCGGDDQYTPDHFEEMGHSLMKSRVPFARHRQAACCVYDEKNVLPIIQEEAAKRRCTVFSVKTDLDDLPDVDFAENEALALSVCEWLGVERSCAIEGIRKAILPEIPLRRKNAGWESTACFCVFRERSGFDAKSTGACPKRRKAADSGHESARGSTGKSEAMRAFCRAVCAG